jgi:hypothetical protein
MSVAAPIVCGQNCRSFRHSAHSRKLRALQFIALDVGLLHLRKMPLGGPFRSCHVGSPPNLRIMSLTENSPGNQISGNPRHRLEVSRPFLPFLPLLHPSRRNSQCWNQPFPLSSSNSFKFVGLVALGEISGLVGVRMEGIKGMSALRHHPVKTCG